MNELNEMKWEWAGRETYNLLLRNLNWLIKSIQWRRQLNQTHFTHQLIQTKTKVFLFMKLISFNSFDWMELTKWKDIITVFIGSNPLSPSIKILMELMIVKEINGIIILFALG